MNNTKPSSSSTFINQTPSFEKANTGDTAAAQIAKMTFPDLERTEAQEIEMLRLIHVKPSKMGLYQFDKGDTWLKTLGRVALYATTFLSLGLVTLALYSSALLEKRKLESDKKKLVCEMVDRLATHVFDLETKNDNICRIIGGETELPTEKKPSQKLHKLNDQALYKKAKELIGQLQHKIFTKQEEATDYISIFETGQYSATLLRIIQESVGVDTPNSFLRNAAFLLEDIKRQRTIREKLRQEAINEPSEGDFIQNLKSCPLKLVNKDYIKGYLE